MEKYVNNSPAAAAPSIQPRTLSAATFGNNTVVSSAMPSMPNVAVPPVQPMNTNQAPVQAPNISNNVPF